MCLSNGKDLFIDISKNIRKKNSKKISSILQDYKNRIIKKKKQIISSDYNSKLSLRTYLIWSTLTKIHRSA